MKKTHFCSWRSLGDSSERHRKMMRKNTLASIFLLTIFSVGCTVKAVGDPNRPITINANIVVDIRGLKKTATGIEDMIAQGAS